MAKQIRNLEGQCVAFTGRTWKPRFELQRIVRRVGGRTTPRFAVTDQTTILVRGSCAVWKYGDYGRKEKRAAELIRRGHPIAVMHELEFQKLVDHHRPACVSDHVGGQPIEWLRSATKEQFRNAASLRGPLDREHSAKGRIEQSFLRYQLFGDFEQSHCCLCGRLLPTSLMVAAHIKPRSECTRRERLDSNNIVFSVCLLGCDALYERGLIGVQNGGRICFSKASSSSMLTHLLKAYSVKKCPAWREGNAQYFRWHLMYRFQG